ncbi:hypothetical protein [Polaromonas sp.]|uniref:hypothetical protein n=1 Tax=Polaromonas sp. TaxID=1869339 RepID=UPI00286B6AB6|nr:hypothetical protein [Polaromonas sp.]
MKQTLANGVIFSKRLLGENIDPKTAYGACGPATVLSRKSQNFDLPPGAKGPVGVQFSTAIRARANSWPPWPPWPPWQVDPGKKDLSDPIYLTCF